MIWGAGFNATPAGSDDRRGGDDRIRELKSELYKRLTLLFNFEEDPDAGGYAFDLVDDVVLAEHVSGLTGTGAVSLDSIPDGSLYARLGVDSVSGGKPSAIVESGTGAATLKCKVIEIGDWNMDLSASITVEHGLADFTKARLVNAIIRNDVDTQRHAYRSNGLDMIYLTSTVIVIARILSGYYDSVDYDSTSYNRGWITLWYEV